MTMTTMIKKNCHQGHQGLSYYRVLKTTAIVVIVAATSVSVSALQPHQHQPTKPKVAARTSTSLDYVSVVVDPETEELQTTTTNDLQPDLKELGKLLYSMGRQMPAEVGVTRAAHATEAPPEIEVSATRTTSTTVIPRDTKKIRLIRKKPAQSKLVAPDQLKEQQPQQKKRRRRRRTTTTTSGSASGATSRLSPLAKLKRNKKARTKASSNDSESVYWMRKGNEKAALLSREEEIVLTERIRALRSAEQVRNEHLHELTPMTEAEWASACGLSSPLELRKVIRQGQDARSRLVQSNMGLVTSIAKRQHASLKHAMEAGNGVGTILTLQDCLQEGQIGLIKAAERFDPTRNVRFSTYATWWIRQRILRSISDTSRIIRLPAHVHAKLMKIRKATKQMKQEIGREPSLPELAHYMEMPVEKLRQYTQSSRNVVSLENPLRLTGNGKNDIDTRTLGDTIASDAPSPYDDAQRESLLRDLNQVLLDTLTPTEREVMLARYGLEDGHSKTLEETSRQLGVSRERVRLVEARALNKLRSPQKNYRLKTYLGGSGGPATATTPVSAAEAPWITSGLQKTRVTDVVDTTNPFATPFDYAAAKKLATKNALQKGGASDDEAQATAEERENTEGPTGERLWFF